MFNPGNSLASQIGTLANNPIPYAYYYTNDKGRTLNWTGIWFGFLGYPPVAGRFDAAVEHDCLVGRHRSAPPAAPQEDSNR